jgi:hypothetical protein
MRSCYILLTLLIFASCSDLDKTDQQKQISDLQKTTDSLLLVLNEADIKDIQPDFNEGEVLLNNLAQLLENDTIQESEAKEIESLSSIIEDFSEMEISFKDLMDELGNEQKNLKKLSSDITNGNGKRNKYNGYIKFEKGKIIKLEELIAEFKKLKTETINKFALQIETVNEFYLSKKEQQP